MRYTFCTLFDKNYLFKGLAMHQSLTAHCKCFTLWVLCMDEETYRILERMGLRDVKLIHLSDFEDDDLRKARQERSRAEYCYTCTAPLILYVMGQETQTDQVAYVDSDLFFYSDPQPIYTELGSKSVLIIGHRFSPEYRSFERESGIYNVSMVIFKKDQDGLECLNWWKEQCLRACYFDVEAGLCYDQKYLDDWPTRFRNVHVLQGKGGGLAPWNISNYQLRKREGRVYVDADELIFYHFHSLKIFTLLDKYVFRVSRGYRFTGEQRALVYSPYVWELCRAIDGVRKKNPDFESGLSKIRFHELLNSPLPTIRKVVGILRTGNLMVS